MKLGTKISLGFAGLIVIALTLGGLAVWNMSNVKTIANTLANANVPEVGVANEVERDSLSTMYETRGYAYTEEKIYLDKARTELDKVKKDLKDAKDHAAKFDLATLKQNAEKAEAKALEYEKLLADTVAKTEAMTKDKAASLVAADTYMKVCAEYLAAQQKKFAEQVKEVTHGATGAATTQPAASAAENEKKLIERTWKIGVANDIVDLGNWIRTGTWQAIATRDPKLFTETEKKFDQVNAKLDELKAKTVEDVNFKQIEECRAAGKAYLNCMESFLTNWLAREEINKKRGEVAQAVLDAAKDTSVSGMANVTKSSSQAASSLATASTVMLVGLGVATVVGILMAIFIIRSITGPVRRISDTLATGADQTASAAGQVSAASQSLAQGASEQAAALEETSSSLEEISSMTKKNADSAQQASALSAEAKTAADKGNQAMQKMSTAINDIQKSAGETAKIIKVIDEIAFQTNLLALNAAVEAARAGEAGKGFAVVAEEVRNLAMRSAEAAKNTSAMIEESVNNARNGVTITQEVAKNLEEITTAAAKVNALVNEINAASQEQTTGLDQVNKAVGEMDKVTQSNAATAEESAGASEELSSQAEQMRGIVGELIVLVNGASGGGGIGSVQPQRHAHQPAAASHETKTAKTGTTYRKSTGPRPNPAQGIPLDASEQSGKNGDFSEFTKKAA